MIRGYERSLVEDHADESPRLVNIPMKNYLIIYSAGDVIIIKCIKHPVVNDLNSRYNMI